MSAADAWSVELEPRDLGVAGRLAFAVGTVASAAVGVLGLGTPSIGPVVAELVIRERDGGREVRRTGFRDGDDAAAQLELARTELAASAPDRFADDWGLDRV